MKLNQIYKLSILLCCFLTTPLFASVYKPTPFKECSSMTLSKIKDRLPKFDKYHKFDEQLYGRTTAAELHKSDDISSKVTVAPWKKAIHFVIRPVPKWLGYLGYSKLPKIIAACEYSEETLSATCTSEKVLQLDGYQHIINSFDLNVTFSKDDDCEKGDGYLATATLVVDIHEGQYQDLVDYIDDKTYVPGVQWFAEIDGFLDDFQAFYFNAFDNRT